MRETEVLKTPDAHKIGGMAGCIHRKRNLKKKQIFTPHYVLFGCTNDEELDRRGM
jgi:hypothetical protein